MRIHEKDSCFKILGMAKKTDISNTRKAAMILASIDPECPLEATSSALRTKDPE